MVESFKSNSIASKLSKSQALKVIFEFFDQADQIKMQALNKRFYNTFCPALVNRVSLYKLGNMSVGFIVFPKDDFVNILQPNKNEDSLCQWHKKKFKMAPDTDWEGLATHEVSDNDSEETVNGPGPRSKIK